MILAWASPFKRKTHQPERDYATYEAGQPARRKCNSFKNDRVAYRARVRRRAVLEMIKSVFVKSTSRGQSRWCVLRLNPLNPHDAINHHFTTLKR